MPFIRGYLRAQNPEKWPAPPHVRAVGYFFNHQPVLPLSVSVPVFTLVMSMLIWNLSDNLWGWIILLGELDLRVPLSVDSAQEPKRT